MKIFQVMSLVVMAAAAVMFAKAEEGEKRRGRNETVGIPKRFDNCTQTVVEECQSDCDVFEDEVEKFDCQKDCFQTNNCPFRALASCQKALYYQAKACVADNCLDEDDEDGDIVEEEKETKFDFFKEFFGCVRNCGKNASAEFECEKLIPKVPRVPRNRTEGEKPTLPPIFNRPTPPPRRDGEKNKTTEQGEGEKKDKKRGDGFFGDLFKSGGRLLRGD